MTDLAEKINKYAQEANIGWGKAYNLFSAVITEYKLKVGVEVGVAFGGHAEAILLNTTLDKLYGIDPYRYTKSDHQTLNFSQKEFDEVYVYTLKRMAQFGERYEHIRKFSKEAVKDIEGLVDFVYIDAGHTYTDVWDDLCAWYSKVRIGGIIGGHDYNHPDLPGVTQAVDEFFRRFNWKIHLEGEGVWWVEKKSLNISFFIPAYNCANTIEESVVSIMAGNFSPGDELIIVNDGSTDHTTQVLQELEQKYPEIQIFQHFRNKGGAAARNTAIEHCQHPLLFCLDSDNILVPGSVLKLKSFLEQTGTDAAYFQNLYFFEGSTENVTDEVKFVDQITLETILSGLGVAGASGNYMFTRESWLRAGGYPEFTWLDTWGFGFRQTATGSKMIAMPDSCYYHRRGHASYFVREANKSNISLEALPIILPFLGFLNEQDINYIMGPEGRYSWFSNIKKRPIRLHPRREERKNWFAPNPGRSPVSRLRQKLRLRQRLRQMKRRLSKNLLA